MLWEKPVLSFGAHRGWSPLLVLCSLPIFGRFSRRKNPFGKKPFSYWEKLLDSLSVLYQSLEDLCGFSRLFVFRWWSSVLDLLGEISAPLVSLHRLSALSVLSLALVGVGILFGRCNFLG